MTELFVGSSEKIIYNIKNWEIVNWPTIEKILFNVSPEGQVNTLQSACNWILGSAKSWFF